MDIKNEVERQFNILKRGCEEIINEAELKLRLEKSLKENKPLKIKLGIDPTGTDLHIGHAVPLRKLKQFQELGHTVQFLIGTFTARIGDPTGKSETRKMLTPEDIQKNIATYLEQVFLILDSEKTEILYNADWLEKLSLQDFLGLLSQFTVAQMISREDFAKRLAENKPVSLVEFMYPILQGYDSVAMKCDIELGATEQKFNILKGRDLQKNFGMDPQICMLLPILEGLDGVEKMSKSLNNYISITDTPNDMFGKIMSISDDLMFRYYEIITDIPLEEIAQLKADMENGTLHPMEIKKRLGSEVVAIYHNKEEGLKAREWFENVFSKKNLDVELPEVELEYTETGVIDILVKHLNLLSSTSEARRLIQQGGLKINDEPVKDINHMVTPEAGMIIRAGKKKIVKVK
ncbi:Tyrosine--tRNA ligase [Sebaldella termitidis]|jgi:tyrosyl-tRNA synthetase|uniref:Tyrosine--tRNA ligase n=1 Tax=Sebaldella termitidis (strain ATCC 33386 / NCTC 11300) TaxID=526218 RepID=D1AG30_SEBTE|nr:tyrosine--tRNA ligase [Sebaldella termitidis]ACZ10656.1 tyrosyl-tRNA synthetase [Sebaldella termitidis ATCC 33386]SUI25997.1 Tyrosine--tRNA ligase [Sebaldella termitidis]